MFTCNCCYRKGKRSEMCLYAPSRTMYCRDCFDGMTPPEEEVEASECFINVHREDGRREVYVAPKFRVL